MKRLLLTLGVAVLFGAASMAAQQTSSPSTDQSSSSSAQTSSAQTSASPSSSTQTPSSQSGTQSTLPSATTDQGTEGGAPNSATPGRVEGSTPSQVQQELDRQMPAGSQVTASVADDGSLKLTGIVASDADKAKAEQIAKQASNKNVDNQLQVKPNSSDQGAVPK